VRLASHAPFVVALAFATYGASCDHVAGPALSAEIVAQDLVPTATVQEADPFAPADICCCRVDGRVRNTSSIPVNVSLRFNGYNQDGGAVGTAVAYVENVPAGGTSSFNAAGIFAACSHISRVEATQFVLGVFEP
jgi:hypothetical protein